MGTWRKSSYSGSNGGDCVAVADSPATILVRDTKDQSVTLAFTAEAWQRFTGLLR